MYIIMSKWTEVRDSIVDALHIEDVTEDVKQDVTAAILSEVLPMVENAVSDFTDKTKEQAKDEKGWCKMRDGIIFPLVMNGIVYVVRKVLEKSAAQTA